MESNGTFPRVPWDESVVEAARALMGRRRRLRRRSSPSRRSPSRPRRPRRNQKPPPPPPKRRRSPRRRLRRSQYSRRNSRTSSTTTGASPGGEDANFVWLMRNALKNVERSLVVTVIHRTTDKKCAEAFVKSEGIKVLHAVVLAKARRRTSRAWC